MKRKGGTEVMHDQDLYRDMDLTIEVSGNEDCVTLLPVLLTEDPRKKTLVASFLVDGIEMIESARIVLSPDRKEHPFPSHVRIHRPVLCLQEDLQNGESYTFTVLFYQAGAVCGKLEKKAVFPAERVRMLSVDEKTVPVFLA